MSDDYLWNATGAPGPQDRDIAKLEALLRPLRAPLPPAPALPASIGGRRAVDGRPRSTFATARFVTPALALAAAIVLMVASTRQQSATPGGDATWDVAQMDGQPRIESAERSTTLVGTGRLAVGETIVTDGSSRARLDVSTIGQVTIDPDTRVRLVTTREGRHELALARGTLHAFISAPPGQFVVNTPSSTATDLGCVYTLRVDEDGSGLLSVAAGWVAFEYKGRESFVPARASAPTDPEFGPGTPRYDDTDPGFQRALERVDYDRRAAARSEALAYVVAHARRQDAMTLWHLIARTAGPDRAAVIDALDRHVAMPIGVTRDAALNLEPRALDLWWNALGLQDATWWRMWKGATATPLPPPPSTRSIPSSDR